MLPPVSQLCCSLYLSTQVHLIFLLCASQCLLPAIFIYIIIHILEIVEPTPLTSFAVKTNGFLCADDVGIAAEKVLPVAGPKAAEGILIGTVLQICIFSMSLDQAILLFPR
jgi:hypothetical protein